MEQKIEAGDRAPGFSLLAAGSGRRLSVRKSEGRSLGLIFYPQGAAPAARRSTGPSAPVIRPRTTF
ncbi:MAG TPA: hypothetical protein VFJ72_00785 [Rubrobacteraceae bacterium]|nr:hypothetical protein [Rubrobacteraceae bacterium]